MTTTQQAVFGDLARTFVDTADEIVRAREQHGDQKHLPLINIHAGHGQYARDARAYKLACEDALQQGDSSWDFILLEEVYEALEAIQNGNLVEARAELIQVLAMVSSIVEIVEERQAVADEVRRVELAVSNALESKTEWVEWDIDANRPA